MRTSVLLTRRFEFSKTVPPSTINSPPKEFENAFQGEGRSLLTMVVPWTIVLESSPATTNPFYEVGNEACYEKPCQHNNKIS